MNDLTKAIINEMLQYIDYPEKEAVLLKKAEEKLTKLDLFVLIRDLLDWNHPLLIKIHNDNPKKMSLIHEGRNNKYKQNVILLLELCKELNALFIVKEDFLVFKSIISETEITEIREYIEKNKKMTIQSKETRMKS